MLYCGADVHSSSTVLHVLDGGGREVLQASLATKEMPLMEFFLGLPKHARVYLEAGTQSAWFSRVVEATGHRAVVVDPNRNRLIAESVKKTDRNDAAALAALGRAGMLSQVWVRQERTEELRRLVGARAALVKVRANLVKVVRAQVRSQGEKLKQADTDRFADLVLDGFWTLPEAVVPSVEPLAQAIRAMTATIDEVENRCKPFEKENAQTLHLLQSVPGVGPQVSIAFLAHVEEPGRFRDGGQVAAYLGLVPSVRESGGRRKDGHITKRGKKRMRDLMVEAAWSHVRSTKDTALKRWFEKTEKRVGSNKAAVGLARKLTELLWTLWSRGTTYRPFPPSSRRSPATVAP
jgi:transposase